MTEKENWTRPFLCNLHFNSWSTFGYYVTANKLRSDLSFFWCFKAGLQDGLKKSLRTRIVTSATGMRPNAGGRKRKMLVPRMLAQIILYKQEMARSMMLRQLLYVCTYCWSESNVKYIWSRMMNILHFCSPISCRNIGKRWRLNAYYLSISRN